MSTTKLTEIVGHGVLRAGEEVVCNVFHGVKDEVIQKKYTSC